MHPRGLSWYDVVDTCPIDLYSDFKCTFNSLRYSTSLVSALQRDALSPLRALSGRCFACLGNHDYDCKPELAAIYQECGIVLLQDASVITKLRGVARLIRIAYRSSKCDVNLIRGAPLWQMVVRCRSLAATTDFTIGISPHESSVTDSLERTLLRTWLIPICQQRPQHLCFGRVSLARLLSS